MKHNAGMIAITGLILGALIDEAARDCIGRYDQKPTPAVIDVTPPPTHAAHDDSIHLYLDLHGAASGGSNTPIHFDNNMRIVLQRNSMIVLKSVDSGSAAACVEYHGDIKCLQKVGP